MNKTDQEILAEIHKNFEAMMLTTECIIDPFNPIKAMIVTGAAGVGKSYNLIKRLEEAHDNMQCTYMKISGKITEMGLFKALYETSSFGSVLLMDDVDVFDSETKLDLLKAALDSAKTRNVSYISSSKVLQDMGIPSQIEYCGKIIFVSNKNFGAILDGKSKLKEHVAALITRGTFVDLKIHDNKSIMIQIEDVMSRTNIVQQYGLSTEQSNEVLQFLKENTDKLREPSLRMAVNLSGLVMQYPNDWKKIAEVSCLI